MKKCGSLCNNLITNNAIMCKDCKKWAQRVGKVLSKETKVYKDKYGDRVYLEFFKSEIV